MGMRYGYPEPPWTYSPKEVEEWINAGHTRQKCKKAKVERHEKWLKNIEIDIDLNVEKEIKNPSNVVIKAIEKVVGYRKIEEHFELIPTSEIILRALLKAGFRKARINGEEIIMKRIKKAMEEIARTKGNELEINAIDDGKASIKISRVHSKRHHSIKIKISKIRERNLQKFLIYIRKRLHGREIIQRFFCILLQHLQ